MISKNFSHQRRAAHAVEFALIAPLLFVLVVGLVVGGTGIFRYHQIASLAREGARYASVRGTAYQFETGQPAASKESIYENVIKAKAVGMDLNRLTCDVKWDKNNSPQYVAPDKTITTNTVAVTVSYEWVPEAYLGGITLSSTSKLPMSH